jgi:hypothetical protein
MFVDYGQTNDSSHILIHRGYSTLSALLVAITSCTCFSRSRLHDKSEKLFTFLDLLIATFSFFSRENFEAIGKNLLLGLRFAENADKTQNLKTEHRTAKKNFAKNDLKIKH